MVDTSSQLKRGIVAAVVDCSDRGSSSCAHPTVFRFAAAPDTFEGRCVAACLADSTVVVISGATAGRLRRLRGMPDGPVHAMTVRRKLDLGGVVVHRTNQLHPDYDVEHRADGIRLLNVPRLIFDPPASTTSASSR